MTTETPPRAQTLRLQSLANWIIAGPPHTPLTCRDIGGRLITNYWPPARRGTRVEALMTPA